MPSTLERQARAAQVGGIAANELESSGSLTLEHILLKNPGDKWKKVLAKDTEFPDDCTYSLGNLCLLTNVNRALGNKGFKDKTAVFAQSDLLLTRNVAKYTSWNRKAVEQRQAYIAKLAVAVWRFN